ncbi:hypothetical protein [Metapseudomonas otitidis]|uniref:hypothetical protein n=1 Tax=Metapseudomonas otitidis TaxID=319939 RepID=UPI00244902AD|nr:hypothetical protein [Pseudomonas otitidis]MDG9784669.1 hypothetical protein [Pseudomonas otitidis]
MRISTEQAAAQQHVYDQLEARDGDAVEAFSTHCEAELLSAQVLPLVRAVIETDDAAWLRLMARIETTSPGLHSALSGLVDHIERHRARFIAEHAEHLIRSAAA